MQRRDFVMALGLAAVWPLPVQAEQPKKVPRIGCIVTGSRANSTNRFPSRTTRTRLCRWPEHRRRGPGGELEDRTVSGSGQRTGRSQGRCHRRRELARRPCCTASDHHDPDRCPKYGRSSCRWARRQPRTTGREYYGANPPRPAARSQAFRLAQGGAPLGFPGGGPLASRRIWRAHDEE